MLPRDTVSPTHAGHAALTTTAQLTEGIGTVLGILHLRRRRLRLCHSNHSVHVCRLRLHLPPGFLAVCVTGNLCLMMYVSLQAHLPRLAPSCMNQPVHPVCMLYLQAPLHTHMAGPTVEPHSGVGSPRETPGARRYGVAPMRRACSASCR